MEEISGLLEESFSLKEGNNTTEAHPRFSRYKNEGRAKELQRQRREEFRQRQASRRFDYLQLLRGLKTEEHGEIKNDFTGFDSMDDTDSIASTDNDKSLNEIKKKKVSGKRNCLMFSEWMVDIPDNFETEWVMKPCPLGKRQLIVAAGGVTNCYAKSGFRINQFTSHLPGGNKNFKNSVTILDCIFDIKKNIFYVLDLITWDNSDFSASEFSLRQYWLVSRFEEHPLLACQTKKCPYSFIPLPTCSCTKEEMTKVMKEDMPYELDGLLFYCQSVYYEAGQTPLVGWLLPWMLPECLDVQVPEKYLKNDDNKEVKEFINEYNEAHDFKGSVKKNKKDFAKKTVLITGGTRGIGKEVAHKLARDSADIVIDTKTAKPHPRLPGTIYLVAEEIEAVGGKALPCIVDIRDAQTIEECIKKAVDKFNGINILINNASAILTLYKGRMK